MLAAEGEATLLVSGGTVQAPTNSNASSAAPVRHRHVYLPKNAVVIVVSPVVLNARSITLTRRFLVARMEPVIEQDRAE